DSVTEREVRVRFTWDWREAKLPSTPVIGKDMFLSYYEEGAMRYCLCDGAAGPQSCVNYDAECKYLTCALNEGTLFRIPPDMRLLLRYLPMREIMQQNGVLFLHASQIAVEGKGILFTAPSGVGKSTQAKLWKEAQNAKIICNDRTLVRKTAKGWRTYGYPFDGSEPVCSGEVHSLGAVVVLEQAQENQVFRMRATKALSRMMQQMVIDTWNAKARSKAVELLIPLIEEVPIYLLRCTPDQRSTECLKEQLRKDSVLNYGNNT
ncbi:MAG: hypothetical protein LUF30_11830, partial [Lachnospiraceae bacterium]|nr:hypothetical protein [Lachnospiraceae bacterium]